MKNVLIINQSAELYGADKVILELILNYPEGYNPIVVLHEEGPLKDLLELRGIQVILTSVIKIKRGIINPVFFIKLPFIVLKSFYKIRKELGGKKIDFIHSNATSVFIGAFYAFFFRKKHLWHVHEIIEYPKKAAQLYPKIVSFFSDTVIFNSKATEHHFISIHPAIAEKSMLVYNGQQRPVPESSTEEITSIRKNYFKARESDVVLGLVGRISSIKGQMLLVEAFNRLYAKYDGCKLIFIGSPPKQKEYYLHELEQYIEVNNLTEKAEIIPFRDNVWKFYDAIDIAIVPSTEKESFGLVATEAMLSGKPVIAAKHGGLAEIVLDHETGLFFEPNNVEDLKNKICFLLENPEIAYRMGTRGKESATERFSTAIFIDKITAIYKTLSTAPLCLVLFAIL